MSLGIVNGPVNEPPFYELVVPSGHYTPTELEVALNLMLVNAGLNYIVAVVGLDATVFRLRLPSEATATLHSVTDVGDSYYAPNTALTLSFAGENARSTGFTLGFRKTNYVSVIGTLTSETSFSFSTSNYVFLEVDDFQLNVQTDSVISTNVSSYMGKNMLARVVLNPTPYTLAQYLDFGVKKREYFGPVRLDKLHFRILTRTGSVADLLGRDYSFMLEFSTIYS